MRRVSIAFFIIFFTAFSFTAIFTENSFAGNIIISTSSKTYEYTGQSYSLQIGGVPVISDVPPVVIDGCPYVPVRASFEKLGARMKWNKARKIMAIAFNEMSIELKANYIMARNDFKTVRLEAAPKMVNDRLMVPLSFFSTYLGFVTNCSNEKQIMTIDRSGVLNNIEFSLKDNKNLISISFNHYKDYNIMRLTGPERIVIDFPNTSVPDNNSKKIDINSGMIKSIRYAQFDKNTARVVLDVNGQLQYKVEAGTGQFNIYVDSPTYKNLTYSNSTDRVCFILNGAKLTEGGEFLKKLFTAKYSADGKQYVITFPSSQADLESGTMQVNDGFLKSVQITCNKSAESTTMVFNAKEKLIYEVITRPEVNNTAITLIKPSSPKERLVVIDPGHGGRETGAIYQGIYEKDLNLDISLKLNNLLKSKNIKTYMIRENDSYVGLYERGYIANDLNAALFLSVHNNAMDDPYHDGTMTLYFPSKVSRGSSFNGERFAWIIQDTLLKTLNTTDRKIIQRPNLVVLKASIMPSALTEIAFMTNEKDRKNLLTEEFRNKAAQGLCDAIIKALKELGTPS